MMIRLSLSALLAAGVVVVTPRAGAAGADEACDLLVLDSTGVGKTGRFRVLDHEGANLGAMQRADEKFRQNASSATFAVSGGVIRVVISSPVPEGMTLERSTYNAWAGDGVELFIRPDLGSKAYCQYSVNAAGQFAGLKWSAPGQRVRDWQSAAEGSTRDVGNGFEAVFVIPADEVFPGPLAKGDSFAVNFSRAGKTCGGLSSWVAVGRQLDSIDAFGKVIYGGTRAYFGKKLSAVKTEAKRDFTTEDMRAAASCAYAPVAAAVKASGDDPDSFDRLEKMFRNLEQEFLRIRHSHMSVMLFEQKNPWGGNPDPEPSSRPVGKLRFVIARNMRLAYPLAFANLCDAEFLGQLKFFEKEVGKNFCRDGGQGIARRFRIYRGFPIWGSSGRKIYDPVEELPMGSVMRLAANEAAPIYLELDARGLPAGKYTAILAVKKAVEGYDNLQIPVEVTVKDLDVGEVQADKFGYESIGSTFCKGRKGCPNLMRLLVDRGYNGLYVDCPDWYPKMNAERKFEKPDFTSLGNQLSAMVAAGLPVERIKVWIFMGLGMEWNCPRDAGGYRLSVASPEWKEGIQRMVTWADAFLRERGVSRDRIYWYAVDEPSGNVDDPEFKSLTSIAHRTGLAIKELGNDFRRMTNPLPKFLTSPDCAQAIAKLSQSHDVIELYRPYLNESIKKTVDGKFAETWTYSIIGKECSAALYRRDYWANMRDGYREIATFWHMTDHNGGDGFDAHDTSGRNMYDDYGTLYADFDNDRALLSRRQLAVDNGFEEARLILCLRKRAKGDPRLLACIDGIVREAADKESMEDMDAARTKLLELVK